MQFDSSDILLGKVNNMSKIIIPKSFPRIKLKDLLHFDVLQYYFGADITAWHGQTGQDPKHVQANIAPYHTNGIYDFGVKYKKTFLMDTEIRNTGSLLENEYLTKKNIRIDVVRRLDLTKKDKLKLASAIEKELGEEAYYGVRRFGSFAKRIRYVGRLFKWIKPNKDELVCCGRWAKIFEEAGKYISQYGYNETIPNDITVYALQGPEKKVFQVRTLKLPNEYYDPKTSKFIQV